MALSVGNPHLVFFVTDETKIDLVSIGPSIEHDPAFPERINVNVASVREDGIHLRTWERGAGMWELVRKLRSDGTTIILTTHYIEEAEEMADRVGVIRKGVLVALGDKKQLMSQMGQRTLKITLDEVLSEIPSGLSEWGMALEDEGHTLCYRFDSHAEHTGIPQLMRRMDELHIGYKDLATHQSSLEDIFVSLVHGKRPQDRALLDRGNPQELRSGYCQVAGQAARGTCASECDCNAYRKRRDAGPHP